MQAARFIVHAPERYDDARAGKNPEAHEFDTKSPSADDPESFLSLLDDPTRPEEVQVVDKLLRPMPLCYKHLAGYDDATMSDDVPDDNHLVRWQKLQLPLHLWWYNDDKTGQVPDLIVIDERIVKNFHEESVKEVSWTYEYDVKFFGLFLDLKGRVQEFVKPSPVMYKLAASEASLAKMY